MTHQPNTTRADRPLASEGSSSTVDTAGVSAKNQAQLVWKIHTLFQRARDARRPVTEQWNRNYYTLYGRPPGIGNTKSNEDVPEAYPIIESLVAWKTDQQPSFDIIPYALPGSLDYSFYDSLAQDLRVCMQAAWANQNYGDELEAATFDAETYHFAVLKATWDANLYDGLGDVVVRRIDPFSFYIDPAARHPRDANYFIEVRTMSLQDMERNWPGSVEKLNGEHVRSDTDEAPSRLKAGSGTLPLANPGAIVNGAGERSRGVYGLPGQSRDRIVDDTTGVTIMECWYRTSVTAPALIPGPDAQPLASDDERTYDVWRTVVICGNTVIMDVAADEMWSHGRHPYIIHRPKQTGELYAPSLVEFLAPSQRKINDMLRSIGKNIDLMGDPVLIDESNSGIRRTVVHNQPGQRLTVKNAEGVKWLQPPQVHPQASGDMISFHVGEMERISGLSAIVRGATPTGRNAQGVIDSVQEAAFVRIRLSLRNLERSLHELGNIVASLIAEFYDEPRIIAVVGESGERTSKGIRGLHFYTPSKEGRVPMRFQLQIRAGSALSTSRGARIAEADALYAMGAIDEEAVLEAHDYPNRKTVVKRVQEMKAAAGMLGAPPTQRAAARR